MSRQRSRIALDIDDTITVEPPFFAAVSESVWGLGRELHIVSSRSPAARSETLAELRGYGIRFSALHLTPDISAAQTLCPHRELDWYSRWLWLKVDYALKHKITHFVDDDPKVLALLARYAPAITAISFEDRHLIPRP